MSSMWENLPTFLGRLFLSVLMVTISSVVWAIPLWIIWNWVMPLFGLVELTFCQTIGVSLIAGLLFNRRVDINTVK